MSEYQILFTDAFVDKKVSASCCKTTNGKKLSKYLQKQFGVKPFFVKIFAMSICKTKQTCHKTLHLLSAHSP